MGLVGQPDSLQRLTRLLNSSDQAFTPEMRAAVARATLEATRTELIRAGNLAPGDELLMLFRGVTGTRTGDYEREGMQLSRLGPGGDEDAGGGLYGSQDFESALRYAGSDGRGAVLPLIVRRSELGNVIDVRSGTPLGDRWLAYVRATARGGVVKDAPAPRPSALSLHRFAHRRLSRRARRPVRGIPEDAGRRPDAASCHSRSRARSAHHPDGPRRGRQLGQRPVVADRPVRDASPARPRPFQRSARLPGARTRRRCRRGARQIALGLGRRRGRR